MAKFSNAKLQLLLYQPNTKRFNNLLWGIYPPKFQSRISKRYLYTYIHCSIIPTAKRWKQPKCPPTWMDEEKAVYICTTECCAALKKKEILPQAAMWMNFEDIMLSEISQPQEDGYCVIPLIRNIRCCQNHRNRKEKHDLEKGISRLETSREYTLLRFNKGKYPALWEQEREVELNLVMKRRG